MKKVTVYGRLFVLVLLITVLSAAPALAYDDTDCGGDCKQVMLSMAYTANLSGSIKLTQPKVNRVERLTKVTAERIDCALASTTVLDGNWERVWGPALVLEPDTQVLHTPDGPKTIINTWDPAPVANTMFVAKKNDAEVYVVAIAGTNPASQFDWTQEDFDAYPVVWPYGLHFNTVRVSRGLVTGLSLLQGMTSPPIGGEAGGAESLESYLQGVVANQEATIYFTGHSLGGALAPVTALWLYNESGAWDPNGNSSLKIYAYAGQTPGDRAFASYTHKRFSSDTDMVIVNNGLDVVPAAFGLKTLEALPTLYEYDVTKCKKTPKAEKCIEPTAAEKAAIAGIIKKVKQAAKYGIYYKTLGEGGQVQGFPGDLLSKTQLTKVKDCHLYTGIAPFLDDYAKEALYQHVCSYPVQLGVPKLNPQLHQCRQQYPGS